MKITLSHLLGHGLRALAANPETTPEQLAEAATAMDGVGAGARTLLPLENARRRPAAPAQDETDVYTAAEVLEIVRRDRKKRAGGRAALDEEDARKKAHSMLDRMLDKKESESEAVDAAMSEFKKSLMDLCKDDEEAMDGEDEEKDDEEAMDEEDDDEDERPRRREDGEADDEAMDEEAGGLMESELIPVGDRPKPALDRKGKGAKDGKGNAAGMDGADVLKLLRPLVAKSRDKALRAAFDATLKQVRKGAGRGPRGIRRNGAGYDAFAGGAGRHANDRAEDGLTEAERMTASFRKFHRKNFDEVKREESSSKK